MPHRPFATSPPASGGPGPPRVLIYSHDTFGLGHLRRARAIANALVSDGGGLSVVIISGSPVIGSFEFGLGVDYVRVPGVVKRADGDYDSLSLHVGLDEAVRLREAIIRQTAETFRPDLFLVDKEPTGFRGEVLPALEIVRARGGATVLGVRDVMDDPAILAAEWARKGAGVALETLYDAAWVYGLQSLHRPLEGLGLSAELEARITYTGYLRRGLPPQPHLARYPKLTRGPFVLVTTGGGGDGEALIDWVLSAYEGPDAPDIPALVVFGPFVARDRRRGFLDRMSRLPKVDAIAFDAKLEHLMDRAAGVVAMGGYNTFCEILSLDKRAVLVPRTRPRLEQKIRADRAAAFGLVRTLADPAAQGSDAHGAGAPDPAAMAAAIRALPDQPKPSEAFARLPEAGLLDGLPRIRALTADLLEVRGRPHPIRQAAE